MNWVAYLYSHNECGYLSKIKSDGGLIVEEDPRDAIKIKRGEGVDEDLKNFLDAEKIKALSYDDDGEVAHLASGHSMILLNADQAILAYEHYDANDARREELAWEHGVD